MFTRRRILQGAGATTLATGARAQEFPSRPVHVFITTAPGGTTDIVSRLTSQSLSDRLGKPFVIENRPGAGGNIATSAVYREPADGHALLSISRGNVLANLLYDKLEFDFARDFEPVAGIASGGLLMLAHPSVPAKSLPEFIAWAKANPSKVNYGTPGIGSDPHLFSEYFKSLTGVAMQHVPYRGGALALTDLLSGNIQIMFSNLPVTEFLNTGKLRALGVTTLKRAKDYPDIPAVAETVPGFDGDVWYAYVARRGAPPDAIRLLNRGYAEALADPKVVAGIAGLGASPLVASPEELARLFAAELEKWGKVIRAANIKPE